MSNPRPFRRSSTAVPLVAVGAVVIGLIVARAQAVLEANDPVTLALCLIGLGGLAILGWRVALVARYRPRPAPADDELPSVTVIVPAFNEGRQVYDTVASIAASRDPAGRLQIIAVDDGSDDDTGLWIARAARDFGSQAIFCPVNRGKRQALYH
ncbi:MAG: glycosyltransferase [Myxococcota bacterium]